MSSNEKVTANRKNAALSTGPKTAKGKAVVAANALVHGLTAKTALLPGESLAAFNELKVGFLSALAPATAIEAYLCEMLVTTAWRLQRVPAIETDLVYKAHISDRTSLQMPYERDEALEALAQEATGYFADRYEGARMERVQRYETSLQRSFYRVLAELRKEQDRRLQLNAMDLP